jgi:hypothetical protein
LLVYDVAEEKVNDRERFLGLWSRRLKRKFWIKRAERKFIVSLNLLAQNCHLRATNHFEANSQVTNLKTSLAFNEGTT